jgi:hypothetical protein
MASSPPIGTRKAFAPAGTMDATFPNTATLLSQKRHTRHKNLLTEKAPYKGGKAQRIPPSPARVTDIVDVRSHRRLAECKSAECAARLGKKIRSDNVIS